MPKEGDGLAQDKATKEKLLESAKKEFLEKGYMKASLRTICKNAGVTTGALYFFFQGKEDHRVKPVNDPGQTKEYIGQRIFMPIVLQFVQQHIADGFHVAAGEHGNGQIDFGAE